jgi:hypothetical protein
MAYTNKAALKCRVKIGRARRVSVHANAPSNSYQRIPYNWTAPDKAEVHLKDGEHLRISVPATSANMGPGFDSFGFALDLQNELVLSRGSFEVVRISTFRLTPRSGAVASDPTTQYAMLN